MAFSTADRQLNNWIRERGLLAQIPSEQKQAIPEKILTDLASVIEERAIAKAEKISEDLKVVKASYTKVCNEHEALLDERDELLSEITRLRELLAAEKARADLKEREIERLTQETKESKAEYEQKIAVAQSIIENLREEASKAADKQRQAEAELAALPEIQKREEMERILTQLLDRALEREEWFLSKFPIAPLDKIKPESLPLDDGHPQQQE